MQNERIIDQYVLPLMDRCTPTQRLIDPFTITHPTAVQNSLVAGASFVRFDPSGRYVAAGRSDGSAAIWDLDTRSAVRWLEGHVKGVTSVE